MKNLDEIKKKLLDKNLTVVAKKTGISAVTLRAIRNGKNKNPSYETIYKLETYLNE